MVEAVCLLLPMTVALIYREDPRPFLYAAGIAAVISLVLSSVKSDDRFFAREGYFSVALIWLLVSALGALPFWFSGCFGSVVDCLFESISGFTTTGASVLPEVEGLPYGILFWRSFTHWLGGMGVLVLTIALLPSLGNRTLQVMRAESPGPVTSKLVPRTSQYSKILYMIYIFLTVMEIVLLFLSGLPFYDSVVHSFATAGTGGFSVRNMSIGTYANPTAEMVITVFMLMFSINFALYYLILSGRILKALKNDELHFFGAVVLASTVLIAGNIRAMYNTAAEAFHYAFFQVATILSTTGFSSANFDQWPQFSRILLVLLMFCGACAGSTGGAIKCSRILVLIRVLFREVRRIVHPRSVYVVRLDGRVLEESAVRSILVFFAAYIVITFAAAQVVSLDDFSFGTTLTAVIACIGNIGPGLELVGPMGNYSFFSPLSKLVLSLCMIIGRLEIFPVLVLLSRSAWKVS